MQFNVPHIRVEHGLRLFWDRVTFSRLTKIYFIFSVLHCVIQVIFQVQAFMANADAATFLSGLIVQGNATDPGFAVYQGDLRMCEKVPTTLDASSCPVVWDGHTSAKSNLVGDNDFAMNSTTGPTTAPATSSTPTLAAVSVISTVSFVEISSTSTTVSTSSALATSTISVPTTLTTSRPIITSTITITESAASPTSTAKVNLQDPDESDSDNEDDGESNIDSDSDDEEEQEIEALSGPLLLHHHDRRDPVLPDTRMRLALNGTATVNLNGVNGVGETELPRKCLYALNWPVDIVENTKREDIAFIAFQIWLLGMSLVALLDESIPHIVASLLTHILATAWGGFQIYNTEVFHTGFSHLTTQGACGINLLPNYWKTRANAEIPSLALNCFALLVSAFLSWRLMKTFGWQTFKRVGASRTINRVYNLVLMLSIAIQLALFFVGASAALWIDQVYNGNIGRLTLQPTVFKTIMIAVLVLLVPWLSTGWISVRKEFRIRMMIFLTVAVLVLIGWATMFIAPTFRWTYATWLFFSLMTTAALILTVVVLILGIVCRINFGKGLTRYLNAHEELIDNGNVSPYMEKTYDSEKIAFPSTDSPVPTFSVTFGSGLEVPPPSQMKFAPRSMGPRFASGTTSASSASNPFETPTETVRSTSPELSRHSSRSSQMSHSSTNSAGSAGSVGSAGARRDKRWVIE